MYIVAHIPVHVNQGMAQYPQIVPSTWALTQKRVVAPRLTTTPQHT